MKKKKNGFTLLEVLVVLVLLSMVTAALFEGLSFTMRVRNGIFSQIDQQRIGVLQSHWIRSVIAATIPLTEPREGEFLGKKDTITGASTNTLGGVPGAPGRYTLTLENKDNVLKLNYTDQYGAKYTLGTWEGADGKFVYIDNFKRFDRWPPLALIKEYQQLPETIILRIDSVKQTKYWAVSIPGRHEAKSTAVQIGI